jgi:hypothetical protein
MSCQRLSRSETYAALRPGYERIGALVTSDLREYRPALSCAQKAHRPRCPNASCQDASVAPAEASKQLRPKCFGDIDRRIGAGQTRSGQDGQRPFVPAGTLLVELVHGHPRRSAWGVSSLKTLQSAKVHELAAGDVDAELPRLSGTPASLQPKMQKRPGGSPPGRSVQPRSLN